MAVPDTVRRSPEIRLSVYVTVAAVSASYVFPALVIPTVSERAVMFAVTVAVVLYV